MADNSTRIVITAEDRASAALRGLQTSLTGISGAATRLVPQFAALTGALSVGSFATFAGAAINAADALNDIAMRTGLSVRNLAEWQLALDQNGASIEGMATGMRNLSVYLVEHGDKLRAAGISATDARGAFLQLADLFKALPEGPERAALAQEIFKKSGQELLPVLLKGSEELANSADKSRAYAKAMEELAPKADQFNDTLAEINVNLKGGALNVIAPYMDGLVRLAEAFNEATRSAAGFKALLEQIGQVPGPGGTIFRGAAKAVDLAYLMGYGADPSGRSASGRIGGAPAAAGETPEQQQAKARAMALIGSNTEKSARESRAVRAPDTYADRINQAVAGAINNSAVVKAQELADQIAALDKLFFDSGLSADVYSSALEKLTGSTSKAGQESERLNELLAATPSAQLEETRKDMQLLAEALERGAITEAQFNEAATARLGLVAEKAREGTDAARELGLTFSSAFEDAIVGGKGLSDVLRGLSQDIARIIVRKSITEPIAGGISDLVKGFDFGSIFGGGRASGGPVDAGKFYVVGENGPEILVPGTSGTVVPNSAAAAMGGAPSVTITQNIRVDSRSDQSSIIAAMIQAKEAAKREIADSMRRGGAFA